MLRRSRTETLGGRLLLSCLVLAAAVSSQPVGLIPPVCPGLQQGICTESCQSAICAALSSFFKSTFNESRRGVATKSWAIQTGWNLTRTQSCKQILSARSSRPSYCSWYGVTCCAQEAIAEQQCKAVHSVAELKMQVNGINGSVDDPAVMQSMLQLHACGLTRLVLQGNDMSGSLSPAWGFMTNLTVLDLGNMWIQGTIPDALQSLRQLTVLNLGTNFLAGALPAWLGELKALRVLSLGSSAGENPDGRVGLTGTIPASLADLEDLRQLNLESNALIGVLPARLCSNSKLSILKLRANALVGSTQQLLNCTQLTQLDISRNMFSGTWPASPRSWNWSQLVALDASYNHIEGSIPDALYALSVLSYLNLGYNRFSGSIQRSITLMQNLIELKLNNNLLSGVVDENLWYLPRLSLLNLSHNKLTGSISTAVGLAFALSEVIMDNNRLSGSLPSELGILRSLKLLDVRNNSAVSCIGNSSTAADQTCSAQQLLPCFMTLGEIRVPRTDGSNLACPLLLRRPLKQAIEACSGDGPRLLGSQANNLADIGESEQKFELDPGYYGYQGCRCLKGYQEVWTTNGTALTCAEAPSPAVPTWVVPSVVVAAVAAVLLLVAVGLLVWLRMTVQLRPRWQREKELNEHRKRGMPSGGPASIVVTDIEKYSDLMQANALLTTKALGVHNAILRKAVAAQAGHVVEQEGDSWSVAFHTPMDAVAFCLQVQQALQKTNWPGDVHSKSFRGHRSFLGNAASASAAAAATASADAAAADASSRSNTSMRGLPASAVNSASVLHGSGRVSSHGQMHSVGWKQQVQVLRSGSGGSADLATAAAAATGSGCDTVNTPVEQLSRTARESRSGGAVAAPTFATLEEDVKEEQLEQEQHKQEPESAGQVQQTSFSSMQSSRESHDASWHSAPSPKAAATNDCSAPSLHSTPDTSSSSFQQLLQSFRVKIKLTTSNSSSTDLHGGSFTGASPVAVDATSPPAKQPSIPSASRMFHSGSEGLGTASTLRSTGSQQLGSINRFWSMMGMPVKDRQDSGRGQDDGIRGLRVRMGVATGWVPRHTDIGRCALFELAKAVSDMANGGQVLLEANTFNGVKNRLTELGTIDHRGYNDKLRANASRALWQQTSMSWLTSCYGWFRGILGMPFDGHAHDTDALLLDLGEYFLPTLAPVIPAAAGGEVNPLKRDSTTSTPQAPPAATATQAPRNKDVDMCTAIPVAAEGPSAPSAAIFDAGVAAVAAAMYGSSAVPGLAGESLQLYSILPRSLHQRAKLCSNSLTFREGTQQTIRSYFDAPGTGLADLSGVQTSLEDFEQTPLPTVTMVFAVVEGGKALIRKKPEVAHLVHNTIGRIVHMLLMALPDRDGRQDGYLCRQQEGVLKYMLAFREPARALEWALLMQEVMLYVPWPDEVLQALQGSSDAITLPASDSGPMKPASADVCRPRLKIGMAEGHPDSITPDHLGRADYFGTFVNLAARMMDAAADGGLVVTSVGLAERLYSTWRFEAELGLHQTPAEDHHQQQLQQQQPDGKTYDNASSQVSLSGPFANMQIPCSASQQPSVAAQQSATGSAPEFQLPVSSAAGIDQSEEPDTPRMAAGAADAVGSGDSYTVVGGSSQQVHMHSALSGRMSASRAKLVKELLSRNAMLLNGPTYPSRLVLISTQHIGTYAFKGCGAMDMVTFITDFMPVPDLELSGNKGGKGVLLAPSSGPVVGLQDCPIVLPIVLPALQQAWSAAAAAVQAANQQHEQDRTQLLQNKGTNKAGKPVFRKTQSSGAAFAAFSAAPDGLRRFQPAPADMDTDTVDHDQPLASMATELEDSSNGSMRHGAPVATSTAAAVSAPPTATRFPTRLGKSIVRYACGDLNKDVDAEVGSDPPNSFLKRLSNSFTAFKRPSLGAYARQQQPYNGEQAQSGLPPRDIQLIVDRGDC